LVKAYFMKTKLTVVIGNDAISELIQYCERHQLNRFMLIADQNTYRVLGNALEDVLREHRFDVSTVVLTGEEVVADEPHLMQVFIRDDGAKRAYLAVGAGTITDIARFVSHRTKNSFISLPTAPSVDGFISIGAPLIISGYKQTISTHPPIAVFADLATLHSAPHRLIASGFGDMIGKYTSLADWRLGHLLWDEPYDALIEQRVRLAVQKCVNYAQEIGVDSQRGVSELMNGLVESGFCMLESGDSRPASGSEHHFSHFWEMKLLQEKRPAILHGEKVGVASSLVATLFAEIRELTRQQVAKLLDTAVMPDRESEIQLIRSGYGPIAEQVIAAQTPFLNMSQNDFDSLKRKVIDRWPEIQEIAGAVPSSQTITGLLHTAGAPVDIKALGLDAHDVALAAKYAHYSRNRFTVMKLYKLLGIDVNGILTTRAGKIIQ
jgi:glycerol-1-phosphate dehydrogenase [NAD(P)+]